MTYKDANGVNIARLSTHSTPETLSCCIFPSNSQKSQRTQVQGRRDAQELGFSKQDDDDEIL